MKGICRINDHNDDNDDDDDHDYVVDKMMMAKLAMTITTNDKNVNTDNDLCHCGTLYYSL